MIDLLSIEFKITDILLISLFHVLVGLIQKFAKLVNGCQNIPRIVEAVMAHVSRTQEFALLTVVVVVLLHHEFAVPEGNYLISFSVNYKKSTVIVLELFQIIKMAFDYSAKTSHKIHRHIWDCRKRRNQNEIVYFLLRCQIASPSTPDRPPNYYRISTIHHVLFISF